MNQVSKRRREERQGDGQFRPPRQWRQIGLGHHNISRGQGRAGSRVFDTAFRLALGLNLGFAIAYHLGTPMPESIEFSRANGVNIPLFIGMLLGFPVSWLLALAFAYFAPKGRWPMLFWYSFGFSLIGTLVIRGWISG